MALRAGAALGVEPEPAPGRCSAEALMAAMATLFPPADPERRAASARLLGGCRDLRTIGPLRAAMVHDPDAAVQVESVRALAVTGDREMVRWTLTAPGAPDPLRAAALDALVTTGGAPAPEEIAALRVGAGPMLAAAIQGLQKRAMATGSTAVAPGAPAAIGGQAVGPGLPGEEVTPARPPLVDPSTLGASGPPPPIDPAPVAVAGTPVVVIGRRPPVPVESLRIPPPPPPPAKPWVDRDGSALAITTSIAAGGLWGGGLSLLAQQDGVGW
jgi:hypothetical protein